MNESKSEVAVCAALRARIVSILAAQPLKKIKTCFREFQVNVYSLLEEFILWNDVARYPDLPVDVPGPSRAEALKRNSANEFQIRYLSSAKEKSIILDLWALLYDDAKKSPPNLINLCDQLNNPKVFPHRPKSEALSDCVWYLKRKGFSDRFTSHRHQFIAHIASIQPTPDNIVEHDYIYRLVPKTIRLVELLHEELEAFPTYFDNQFATIADGIAHYFSHSEPDPLLAELFAKRSLPAVDFFKESNKFLKSIGEREKAAHQPSRQKTIFKPPP
jgi:hypothetical protein